MAKYQVRVPDNVSPGESFTVNVGGRMMRTVCPMNSGPGQMIVLSVDEAPPVAEATMVQPSAPPASMMQNGQVGADLYRSAISNNNQQQQNILQQQQYMIEQQQRQIQQQQQIINAEQQRVAQAPPPPPSTVYIQSAPQPVVQPVVIGAGGYYGDPYMRSDMAFAEGMMMGAAMDSAFYGGPYYW